MPRVLISKTSITGEVKAFAGTSAPEGYLFCQGQAVSRTTYAELFAVLGTSHGQGDGSTTFNLPDYRGQFLRGRVNISTINGTGSVISPNQATFTNHGINRTGFRVRLSSGTLSGLAAATDYFAIVVDANTLAFATTQANALSNTRIAISGTNSAVITQFEDPDASSRLSPNVGGNNGNSIGGVQPDGMQGHVHQWGLSAFSGSNNFYGSANNGGGPGNGVPFSGTGIMATGSPVSDGANGVSRTTFETRVKNSLINYIIKF